MKRFAPLLLAASMGLTACEGGMNNHDYLQENVATWNSMVSTVELWTNGPRGEAFHTALQDGKSLEQYRFGLKNAHDEATRRLESIELLTHGKSADPLHQTLRDSVKSTAAMFEVMVQIAALPDGYTEEQVTPLLEQLDTATEQMDKEMEALSDAQEAFAKANRIQLQTTG